MSLDDDIVKDVYQVKAELSGINLILERVEESLRRLADVSQNVSEMIAVQENRLSTQEKIIQHLITIMETRQKEFQASEKNIEQKIEKLENEIYKELETNHKELIKQLIEHREETNAQFNSIQSKFANMEKFVWVISGGAAVVGFILSKIINWSKIFG